MANLGMIGGIGAGVMQGLGFLRQMESDKRADQALQNQSEQLRMQRDLHGELMGALNKQHEEEQRTGMLDSLKTNIESNYADKPDYERSQMFIDNGLKSGIFKPADLDAATKVRDQLVQMAGPSAYRSLVGGDIKPMQSLLKTRGIDLQADSTDGSYLLRMPGSDTPQSVTKDGLAQLDAMALYRDQEASKAKVALDAKYKLAQIKNLDSRSDLNEWLPQEKFSLSAGGVGRSGRGAGEKEPKPYDPIGALDDFNKAIGNDQNGQPYKWAPTALQHYQQILEANPNLASSKQGSQYALNFAMELGKGNAKAIPEIDANGNIKLIGTWPGANGQSPRKVVLQNAVDMGDLSLVQGVGGEQIVKPEEWIQAQGNAVQSYAKARPDEYRIAAAASADDAALAQLAESAKKNPDAARAYNFAKMVRGLTEYQKTVVSQPKNGKSPLTPEEQRVASVLGVNPEEPGLLEKAKEQGSRFLSSARGVLNSLNGDQFESGIKMAKSMPNLKDLRIKLLEMARGNPERMARLEEAFGNQAPVK